MMDVSQFIPFLNLLLVSGFAWMTFRFAKSVKRRWLRIPIRAVTCSVGVMGATFVVLLLLFDAACTRRAAPITAPDGQHVAVLTYALQGALGDDYANVGIRASWSPRAESVYSGLGHWNFKEGQPFDPQVSWLDSTHLLISYLDDRTGSEGTGGPPACKSKIDGVEINCRRLP
jgi:hypothetical protein